MNLTLIRNQSGADGIFSELVDATNQHIAWTLEHAYQDEGEVTFNPKLKPGDYLCKRGMHKLSHGPEFETFEVRGVKGHTGILFHKGNYNADSDGCILLGTAWHAQQEGGVSWIENSKVAFDSFMKVQEGVDEFWLMVTV